MNTGVFLTVKDKCMFKKRSELRSEPVFLCLIYPFTFKKNFECRDDRLQVPASLPWRGAQARAL